MAPTSKSQKSKDTPTPKGPKSSPKSVPRSADRVLGGRIVKSAGSSASKRTPGEIEDDLDDDERQNEAQRYQEMMKEKKLFPGSEDWAEDEERLFQLLFMRQFVPILPSHWGMDFRGIYIPDILFATSTEDDATIYSASGCDFRATKALIRLIDLTSSVRDLIQTSQRAKVPQHMKREIDLYLRWAARDGGFDNLDYLSNIIVDIVDTGLGRQGITDYMETRLKDLANDHREFWKATEEDLKAQLDKDIEMKGESGIAYVKPPPVLYGLFIINSTLMILTMDPAKEDAAEMSYQVEVLFSKRGQGMWNAFTVAMVACLARGDTMQRKAYFSPLDPDTDIDPDE